MNLQTICFICLMSAVTCSTLQKVESKLPKILTVTEENKHEYGLPVGTILKKDKRTQLYKPPDLSDNFDAEARFEIQWRNKQTGRNFCKVGPGVQISRNRDVDWCKNEDGDDVCCGTARCSCNLVGENCMCFKMRNGEIHNIGGYYEQL